MLVIPAVPPKVPNGAAEPRFTALVTGNGVAVTVNAAMPVLFAIGSAAVIVIGPPTANAVASPAKPAALSMVATGETSGVVVQVTDDVKSRVVRSEYVPVATNC